MKRFTYITLLAAFMLACFIVMVPAASASGKIRVAVVDFDTTALHANWTYYWSYNDLSRAAADNLTTELVKSNKFSMIERQQLDLVMAEQNLGASGRLNTQTAAKIGKILGVQIIIVGSVTDFGVSGWGGNVPQVGKWKWGSGIGGKMVSGKANLNCRMIDTTTAEILAAFEASGSKKFGKGSFSGADFGKSYDSGTVSKVLAKAIDNLAIQIIEGSGDITPSVGSASGIVEGKIALVSGSKVYTTLGSYSGVKVGDLLTVYRVGKEIRDPDTDELLDVETEDVGTLLVTEVKAKTSIGAAKSGGGFKKGDLVKRN